MIRPAAIATHGLIDRGALAALTIATSGLLYAGVQNAGAWLGLQRTRRRNLTMQICIWSLGAQATGLSSSSGEEAQPTAAGTAR